MTATDRPATIHELREACPGAASDFLLGQLQLGATRAQAVAAWIDEQTQTHRLPAACGAERDSDAVADFDQAVLAEMGRGVSRRAAILAVARREPELHKRFLLATNARTVHNCIADRFDPAA